VWANYSYGINKKKMGAKQYVQTGGHLQYKAPNRKIAESLKKSERDGGLV